MIPPAVAFEPFTEEHQAFRRLVRDFAEKELAPNARAWDEKGEFPRELFRRFGEMGFLGIRHDPAWGGSGLDYWYVVAYAEELVRSRNGGLGTGMLVQGEMATPIIGELGTDEQKREFLAPALRGEKIAALAISEPDAGSDVAAIRTRARRDGDDLVISGSKTWISNGSRADFLTMAVRTGEDGYGGISLVTFPTDVQGFQVSRKLEKVGNLSSDTAVLFFDDCRIPARYLLGEENQGFGHIMTGFQGERLVAAVTAVAGAQLLLDDAHPLRPGAQGLRAPHRHLPGLAPPLRRAPGPPRGGPLAHLPGLRPLRRGTRWRCARSPWRSWWPATWPRRSPTTPCSSTAAWATWWRATWPGPGATCACCPSPAGTSEIMKEIISRSAGM